MRDKPRDDEPRHMESAPRDDKSERSRPMLGDRATDQRAGGGGRDSAVPRTESGEPAQLRSGREFHKHLQSDAKARFGAEAEKHVEIPNRQTGEMTRTGRIDLYYKAEDPAGKDVAAEIKVRNLARYEERDTTDKMVDSQSRQLAGYRDGIDHTRTGDAEAPDDEGAYDGPGTHGLMIIRDSSRSDDEQATEWSADERQAHTEAVAEALGSGDIPPPHPDAERLNRENDAYLATETPDQRDDINTRHATRGDEVHFDDERALYDDDHPLQRGHLAIDDAEDQLKVSLGEYGDLRALVERLREEDDG